MSEMEAVNASVARDDARRARAVEVARKNYGSEDVAVAMDENVHVHSVDGGYWISARVWVDADAVEPAAVEAPPMMLDSLASFARTALTDPSAVGLRPFELGAGDYAKVDGEALKAARIYAVHKLDEIIEALNPSDETRETMTDTLSVLGRHLAERADEMDARDAEEPDRTAYRAAASNVRAALDLVDVAIGLLTPDES